MGSKKCVLILGLGTMLNCMLAFVSATPPVCAKPYRLTNRRDLFGFGQKHSNEGETIHQLPLMLTRKATVAPIAKSDRKTVGPTPRSVLIVDDNKDAADTLAMLVRMAGHRVYVAYGGETALQMAKQQKPEVIFLDIGLPKMDGYQVAERLRQQPETTDVFLVAITGYEQVSDREHFTEVGFNLHLLKPADLGSILRLLDSDLNLLIENKTYAT